MSLIFRQILASVQPVISLAAEPAINTKEDITADECMMVCYIGIALCAMFALITVFLFFKLNIIGVIGDLSGSSARKGIENIRNQNQISGNKAYKSSNVNRERGKLTDKITSSGRLASAGESVDVSVGTEKFKTGELPQSNETVVLDAYSSGGYESDETTVLMKNATDETTVLASSFDETTILNVENLKNIGSGIVVEEEIVFVHSNERIS